MVAGVSTAPASTAAVDVGLESLTKRFDDVVAVDHISLELELRKQMQLELKRIQHEVGLTFIHVTHDQEEAMTMADQIVVMNNGHIEQAGTPAELYEHPATAFVASFLGVSNLLPGEIVG